MVLHGIAKGWKRNVRIFNTSTEAADPVYVTKAEHGTNPDTDIPVV